MKARNDQRDTHAPTTSRAVRAVVIGTLLATTIGWASVPDAEARPFERLAETKIAKRIQDRPKPLRNALANAGDGPLAQVFEQTMSIGREAAGDMLDEFHAFGGRDCFPGSPCERFRRQLATMLDDVVYLLEVVPVEAIDGRRLQNLQDRLNEGSVPPFALFLVYQAVGDNPAWLEVPNRVIGTVQQMPRELLEASSTVLFGAPDDPYAFCGRVLVQEPARFKVWKARLGLVKPTLAVASAILHTIPDIDVGAEAGAAVANVQGNVTIKIGKMFDVPVKAVGLVVDQVNAVMDLELAKYEACNPS